MSKFQISPKAKKKIEENPFSEWSLKINRVGNGYILEGSGGETFVIEEKENDDLYEHEQLLFKVREYFNFEGTKHDRERIQILRQINALDG